MIDRLQGPLPHRTPDNREWAVKNYGEDAAKKVARVEPHLDSLDVQALGKVYQKVLEHQVKYAEGFLPKGMDAAGSVQRKSTLNMLSSEIAEVVYWKGRGVGYEHVQPRPVVERVSSGELVRIREVLTGRLDVLKDQAPAAGVAERAMLLVSRYHTVNNELTRRNGR